MKPLVLALALTFCSLSAFAQQPVQGFPPFGTFQDGQFDHVNLENLNVMFSIPVVSVPGRGLSFSHQLTFNSLTWQHASCGQFGGQCWTSYLQNVGGQWIEPLGWYLVPAFTTGVLHDSDTWTCDDTGETTYHTFNYRIVEPNGTVHFVGGNIFDSLTECGFGSGGIPGVAYDGSGFYTDGTTGYTPSGVQIPSYYGQLKDTNGNFGPSQYAGVYTDTVGHSALKTFAYTSDHVDLQYQDTSGTYQTVRLNFSTLNIQTNFGCSYVTEANFQAKVLTSIVLPNGQSYTATYEDTPGYSGYTTGRLKRITLPTGGYYEYQYPTTGNGGIMCDDATGSSLTRVINDGTNSQTWQYSRTQTQSGHYAQFKTVVTAPQLPYDSASNDTTYLFSYDDSDTGVAEMVEKQYQGPESSNQLLRTVDAVSSCTDFGVQLGSVCPTASQTVILPSGLQSKTETDYASWYNGPNLLEKREYDWGSGAPGSLLRRTTYTYLATSPYTALNILDRVTREVIKDGSGNIKFRQDTAYDESGYINQSCPTGVNQHDDTNYGCSFTTRGLPTSVTTYSNAATPSGGVTKNFQYDVLGNVITALKNSVQQKALSYSSAYSYAYPTTTVSGPSSGTQLTVSASYSAYTGQVVSTTDENGQTTTYAYDSMGRPITVTGPDSNQITTAYDDSNFIVTSTTPITSSTSSVQKVYFDGLGRPVTTETKDGGGTSYAKTNTQYDTLGRAYKSSNPYTSSASYWTESRFDGAGRQILTIPPDGSSSANNISTSYSANCVTSTDQAGKSRKSCSDGLGRMTQVFEDPSSSNYETDYSYNIFDALTAVTQGSQSRSYSYDDMGRLTQSVTPEAGTTQFAYNAYNLNTSRTDARGVVTTYSYDTLNRSTQVSYNVGSTGVPTTPTVNYTYAESSCLGLSSCYNAARLTTVADGVGSEKYAYDFRGRAARMQKVISSTTYTTDYAYNLGNELTSVTYPSGRVVAQNHDSLGRLCSVGASGSGCSSGTLYAGGITYNTGQEVTAFNYGNGVAASLGYSSDRLQMTSLSYAKSGTPLFGLSYYYKTDSTNCSTGASGNNGQIQCIADTFDSGRTAHYTYDALARLSTAATTGSSGFPAWGLSWTYDRYGNRTAQSIASGCTGSFTCPTSSISVSATTNRFTGSPYTYDANGSITNDGLNSLVYNAENQIVTINSGANEYQYDGNGVRVKKCAPNCASPTSSTVYVFTGEKVLAEYDNGAAVNSPTREYIYAAAGALLARFDGSTLKYYQQDHLSNRLITDSSGSVLEQKGHFPFGEDWYQGGDKWKFTTYERDSESGGTVGNDYAMARYYASRSGRFLSPDPGGVGTHPEDPQTWNGYVYAGDDPILNADPSGLDYYVQIHIHSEYATNDFHVKDFYTLLMLVYGANSGPDRYFLTGDAESGLIYLNKMSTDQGPILVADYRYQRADGDNHWADTEMDRQARLAGLMHFKGWDTGNKMEANTDWWTPVNTTCAVEGAERVMKDLTFADEIIAVGRAVSHGSMSPLKELFTVGYAAEAVHQSADYVGTHRAAQLAIRGAARSEGIAVSASKVARAARIVGKAAAMASALITGIDGISAYQKCMSQ